METETHQAKHWQAEIWSGETATMFAPTYVYGPSLDVLRAEARSWLLSARPACFSNLCPASQFSPGIDGALSAIVALYSLRQSPGRRWEGRGMDAVPFAGTNPARRRHPPRSRRKAGVQQAQTPSVEQVMPQSAPALLSPVPESRDDPLLWCRLFGERFRTFSDFSAAVDFFTRVDLLPAKGPEYSRPWAGSEREFVLLHHMHTIRVEDNSILASYMLERGWVLLYIQAYPARKRGAGDVLFVLGHAEAGAV
jgi:hypothetical protein